MGGFHAKFSTEWVSLQIVWRDSQKERLIEGKRRAEARLIVSNQYHRLTDSL